MKIYITLFSVVLFSFHSSAQIIHVKEKTSGYFGKQAVLGFTGLFSISNEPQTASYKRVETGLSINKAFGANLQYALTNSSAIRIGANYSQTSVGIYQSTVERRDAGGWSSWIDYGDIYYKGNGYHIRNVTGTPRLTDRSIELEYKYFRKFKGGISPLGTYISGGLAIHNFESDISYISISASLEDWRGNDIYYTLKYQNPIEKRTMIEAYAKAGYGTMLTQFLLLDTNVRFGYLPSLLLEDASNLQTEVYSRLTRKQILNFEVTLGIPF
ncbi:MAG: hypothetical protein ACPGTP_00760 [Bacteroidia bacterium]